MSRPAARVLLTALAVTGGATAAVAVAMALQAGARADGVCSIYWTGATNTSWNTASNWSATDGGPSVGRVPAATDVVCMSAAPTRGNVVYPAQSKTYVGLNFANPATSLEIQGGTLTVNTNAGSINNLTFDGGTLAGSAPLSLTGALTFPSGSVTFTGATKTVASGATLSTSAFVTVGGTTAGQSGSLVNAGTVTLLGTSIAVATGPSGGTGSTFTNNGALTLRNGSSLDVTGSGPKVPAVTNTGSLTVSGTADATVSTPFTNSGTVTTTNAALIVANGNVGGTTDTGSWVTGDVPDGVSLASGTRSLTAGAVTGDAGLTVSGATVTFSTGVTVSALTEQAGTISGSVSVVRAALNGGTLAGGGTLTTTGAGTRFCSVSINNGYTLVNTGTATLDAGNCDVAENNGGHLVNSGTLTITGNTGDPDAVLDDGNTANSVLNDTGATLTVSLDTNALSTGISSRFTNRGTVTITKGTLRLPTGNIAGTTDTGTVAIANGATLALAGGARTIASTTVSGPGSLSLSGATVTFTGTPSVTNLAISSGSVNGDVTVATATLVGGTLTGAGTMTTTGAGTQLCSVSINNGYTLVNTGTATLDAGNCDVAENNGGHLVNSGTLTITGNTGDPDAVLDDGNTANSVLNDTGATLTVSLNTNALSARVSSKFTNRGTLNVTKGSLVLDAVTNLSGAGVLTGGTWTAHGGTIKVPNPVTTNAATVVIGTGGAIVDTSSGNPAFATLKTNTGSFTTTPGLTTTTALTNAGTLTVAGGTLRANSFTQTTGTTTVAGGAILKSGSSGTAAVLLNGGTLTGSGTVQGVVSGPATVAPGTNGAGTLTITGSYAAQGGSTFAPTVGATTANATVSGAVTLAGTLALTTTMPLPTVGTTVTVLNGASRSGTFTTVTGQDVPGSGVYWAVSYTATGVVVTLTADPTVSIAGTTVAEGNSDASNATFAVSLSAPSQVPVTVAFSTADGTATAGSDYTATSGTVVFPVGSTGQTVTVPVTGDTVYENDETFTVTLAAPSGATLGASTATGTIVNDDTAPVVSIGSAGGSIDKFLGTTIAFPVSLSAASALDVQVTYATSDGTATAPNDYAATSGTLTIPAGSTNATVSVVVPAQPGASAPKTFTVTLSAPVNATLGTATATGTITNANTAGGTPTVTSVSPNLGAQGASVDVTIAGADLEAGSTVSVAGGGVTVSNVVYQNSAQLTARFTIAGSATPGARDVVVTGPTVGAATCSGCFTVTARPTVGTPSVTAFAQGNVDVLVGVTGSNFGPGTTLSFVKGTKTITAGSVIVNSATSLTVSVSVATGATTGAYDVVVANPDGGTGTCAGCVKVFAAPKVKSVSPSALTRGTPTTVTVTGTGFVAGAVLTVQDCTLSNVTVVNATTITATVTPRANASTGSKTVKVFNPASAGSGTTSGKLVTVS